MYSRIFPFGTLGGDHVNSISVSERGVATTFSGFSGYRRLGVVGRNVVRTGVVGSGVVVGGGVVGGRGSPVLMNTNSRRLIILSVIP